MGGENCSKKSESVAVVSFDPSVKLHHSVLIVGFKAFIRYQ